MKGVLHKTDKGWVVKYFEKMENISSNPNEVVSSSAWFIIPLHPDNIKDAVEGKEVEFEIDMYDADSEAPVLDCETSILDWEALAKLIIPKQQESWKDVFDGWKLSEYKDSPFMVYLNKIYHPPVKKMNI